MFCYAMVVFSRFLYEFQFNQTGVLKIYVAINSHSFKVLTSYQEISLAYKNMQITPSFQINLF